MFCSFCCCCCSCCQINLQRERLSALCEGFSYTGIISRRSAVSARPRCSTRSNSLSPPPILLLPLVATAAHRIIFKWGAACFYCHSQHSLYVWRGERRGQGAAGRGLCRIQAASWCSFRYSSVQLNEMFCGSLCLSLTRAVALPLARFPTVHLLVAPRSMQQFFMVRIQAKIMFSYSRVRNLLGQWAENKWTATERVAVTVGVVGGDVCGWGGVCVCL